LGQTGGHWENVGADSSVYFVAVPVVNVPEPDGGGGLAGKTRKTAARSGDRAADRG